MHTAFRASPFSFPVVSCAGVGAFLFLLSRYWHVGALSCTGGRIVWTSDPDALDYCPLLPLTALYCPLLPRSSPYCPLMPLTAPYCPSLSFTAPYFPYSQTDQAVGRLARPEMATRAGRGDLGPCHHSNQVIHS